MEIKTVTYKQKFPTFQYLNCDIGFEASVPPGKDPLEVLKELQNLSELFHKQSFPHLYTPNGKPITFEQVGETQVIRSANPIEALIQDINSCGEVKVLETYKLMVKGKPEVEKIYEEKMKSLLT